MELTKIVELTADRYHCDGRDAFLTLRKNPAILPPTLATLIEQQLARRRRACRKPHSRR